MCVIYFLEMKEFRPKLKRELGLAPMFWRCFFCCVRPPGGGLSAEYFLKAEEEEKEKKASYGIPEASF